MVANFLMRDFPAELPDAPLSWDNVVYQEPGLGYAVSTPQDIRQRPPEKRGGLSNCATLAEKNRSPTSI